jgi:hypothetical protein
VNKDHVGSTLAVTDDKGRRVNDSGLFPLRGQFVNVQNLFDKSLIHHWIDATTAVVSWPFGGRTVIGGTKELGIWCVSCLEAC